MLGILCLCEVNGLQVVIGLAEMQLVDSHWRDDWRTCYDSSHSWSPCDVEAMPDACWKFMLLWQTVFDTCSI